MSDILALDLGTKTGWATGNASGTVDFKNGRFCGGGMRFLKFRKWLFEMVDVLGGIDAVYFEEVQRHVGTAAAHCYGGFMATLTAFCEEQKIPYSGVPVGTIKKSACGRGNANKKDMIEAAVALGYSPIDDNDADAIHLYRFAVGAGD